MEREKPDTRQVSITVIGGTEVSHVEEEKPQGTAIDRYSTEILTFVSC